MKRLVSVLSLIAFLGISGLSASVDSVLNSAESKSAQTLSKADSEFLFGTNTIENLNVEVLSQKELEETQGESWFSVATGIFTLGVKIYEYGKKDGWWNFRF